MWSDKESEKDYLNFGEVSQLVADTINSPGILPVLVEIFGAWGAGESSLLRLIESELRDDPKDWIVIKFDAWLYQAQPANPGDGSAARCLPEFFKVSAGGSRA